MEANDDLGGRRRPGIADDALEFDVALERVLDLTAPKVLERLEITLADLLQPGAPGFRMPQTVATAARGRGYTGILAPTARPDLKGANLVVFLEFVANLGASVRLLGQS